MFASVIARLVDGCRRFASVVVILALVATGGLGVYVAQHIKINTDLNQLLAEGLDWRTNEKALEDAFPQTNDRLVIVVDGANPDLAEEAAAKLSAALQARPELFKNVTRPDAIPFFRKNGLLFLDSDELSSILENFVQAQPLLGSLASDPSLRGLFSTLNMVLLGLREGQFDYAKIDAPLAQIADVIDATVAGQDKVLALRSLQNDKQPTLRDLRKIILTQPVLDYAALSPGAAASAAVRHIAEEAKLTQANGVTVRLTGSVALNDEEFASVADGTTTATIMSVVLVLLILFLALRSARLILPILLTLTVGLVATTAFAMAAIGSLNLISVAFAVMFVGIAVDFGIQFGVRFRDQHHQEPDTARAMQGTARLIALPLALAAGATALGFLAFVPTDYRGVAELGLIAGAGMIIAFILNITLLPALLTLFKPPAEPEAVGFAWAAPVDRFLIQHRKKLLIVTALVALVSVGGAAQTRFDFDPLNLKDPHSESVSTLFDLMRDPDATLYTVQILAPTLEAAQSMADQLGKLPEVDHVMTLASFIPEKQDDKRQMIEDAQFLLGPSLSPATTEPAPTDAEIKETLQKTIAAINEITPPQAALTHLAESLGKVVTSEDPALMRNLHAHLVEGPVALLAQARESLEAQNVTLDGITDDLRRDWVTPDGRAKVEVYPKGNPRDHATLEAFTEAVRTVVPDASGTSVSIQESGRTITHAFIKAGLAALVAIALLVWGVTRRWGDVVRLLAPLVLAGLMTLATIRVLGIPLNYANIIALPLLLSLGVSYAIYFVTAWRQGLENPLQSSMARAVLFSAATTLVAFGSLSLSAHPGTSSMGELLTIALLYCVLSTFLVLPLLLGKPKKG